MTELIIEYGIPLPNARGGKIGPITDAIRSLAIDQSVFVPGKSSMKLAPYISSARRDDMNKKYTMRKSEKDGVSGTRVWRIA